MNKAAMRVLAFLLAAAVLVAVPVMAATAKGKSAKPTVEIKTVKPTQEGVLGLANEYIKSLEPKLSEKDKEAYASIKQTIFMNQGTEHFRNKAINQLVSNLSLSLASGKSFDGLTFSSAYLLTLDPKNIRTINLFGSVLHSADKFSEASSVLQYGLTIDPDHNLLRLNMANVYLDLNQDEKAKPILDKLEFVDSENKAVFRALATYWYKKKNAAKFREYLFKAASFKGYKRKKTEKKREEVEEKEVKQEESTEAMEVKLKGLEDSVPFTTADILEEDFPDAARQIRDKYGKLQTDEKWILPKLPMVNLNGPPDFARNQPIVEEWSKVALERLQIFQLRKAQRQGVDINASEEVKEAQAEAAGKKQAAEALQQAKDMLKYMENMPGVSKADIDKAKQEIEKATKEQSIQLEDKPVDTSGPPPSVDTGGLFSEENYRNYLVIENSYEMYFMKYYREFQAKVQDIVKVYGQKASPEIERFKDEWDKIVEEEHYQGYDVSMPDEQLPIPLRKARLEHRKRMNGLSDNYYRQWSGLYFPQYAQKMKPTLDAYFNTCMLHIRNMHDPKIMEQEYDRVTAAYVLYASQAVTGIGGGVFPYYPETYQEELALEAEIAKAKEEAEAKKPEFKRDFQSPEFSWTEWINDHFVLEVSGEFLALKITPHSIEFEASVVIVGGGAKYDFDEQKFETYTSAGAKFEAGVNICGVGAKVEAKGDVYRRTATWDLKNGTYQETDSAKAEVKGSVGPLSAGGEVELDTQLNAKVTGKVSLADTATIQGETEF